MIDRLQRRGERLIAVKRSAAVLTVMLAAAFASAQVPPLVPAPTPGATPEATSGATPAAQSARPGRGAPARVGRGGPETAADSATLALTWVDATGTARGERPFASGTLWRDGQGYELFDVRDLVTRWLSDGLPNAGFLIRCERGAVTIAAGRGVEQPPQLVVSEDNVARILRPVMVAGELSATRGGEARALPCTGAGAPVLVLFDLSGIESVEMATLRLATDQRLADATQLSVFAAARSRASGDPALSRAAPARAPARRPGAPPLIAAPTPEESTARRPPRPAPVRDAPSAADLPAGTTRLGATAARMRAGELIVFQRSGDPSGFSKALLRLDGQYITQYATKGMWDPLRRHAVFIGSGHLASGRHLRYLADEDRWVIAEELPKGHVPRFSHAYEHHTVDPSTGDIYRRYAKKSIFDRYLAAEGRWEPLPATPLENRYVAYASAMQYFPPLGGVLFFDAYQGLWLLRDGAPAWQQLAAEAEVSVGKVNHVFAVYHPQHQVVLLGGGNDNRRLYALDADGRVIPRASQPAVLGPSHGTVTVDPVSGDVLAFTRDLRLYVYDYAADRWSDRTAQLAAHPGTFAANERFLPAIPISTYGVIMFPVFNHDKSVVLLYRHAGSGDLSLSSGSAGDGD